MVMPVAFGGLLVALLDTQAAAVQVRVAGHQNRTRDADVDAKHDLCTGSRFTRVSGWPECGDAPWKPPAVASKSHEMCIDGKALPKLYVLGAQKTGTSSLANDLACAGVLPVPSKSGNEKEFSYFTGRMHWNGIDEEKSKWRELLPECSYNAEANTSGTQSSVRMVGDMTPNNLRMVPGETTYGKSEFVNLPNTLLNFYGHGSKQITFVAMIREPLSRMQSAWYAARECDNHAICTRDCTGTSFNADLRKAMLNAHKEEPLYTEWLWTGMYGRQLEQWLKKFDAKQMYVVPYLQYSKGDADSICRDLSERADFHMDCDGKARGKGVSHSWSSGEHPSLEGDIMPKVRTDFDVLMNAEKDRLVRVLAEGSRNGMGLANYDKEVGDEAEIRAWLENWW